MTIKLTEEQYETIQEHLVSAIDQDDPGDLESLLEDLGVSDDDRHDVLEKCNDIHGAMGGSYTWRMGRGIAYHEDELHKVFTRVFGGSWSDNE